MTRVLKLFFTVIILICLTEKGFSITLEEAIKRSQEREKAEKELVKKQKEEAARKDSLATTLLTEVLAQGNSGKKSQNLNKEDIQLKVKDFWDSKIFLNITSKPASSWNYLDSRKIKVKLSNKIEPAIMEIYKVQDKYVSLVEIDEDNFFYMKTPTKKDKITGKEVIDIPEILYNPKTYFCKAIIDDYTFINSNNEVLQLIIGGEFPVAITIDARNKGLGDISYGWDNKEQLIGEAKSIINSLCLTEIRKARKIIGNKGVSQSDKDIILGTLNKNVYFTTPLDEKLILLEPLLLETFSESYTDGANWNNLEFTNSDFSVEYLMGENKITKRLHLKFDNPTNSNFNTFKGIKNYFNNNRDYINLNINDQIKNISKDDNIVTVYLNDDDYLKYSLYANCIFEGRLKRKDGIFELKLGEDSPDNYRYTVKGKFIFAKDMETDYETNGVYHYYGGKCIIPASSELYSWFPRELFFETEPAAVIVDQKNVSGRVYDTKGENTHIFKDHNVFWNQSDKIEAQKKLEAQKALKAKEKPKYDALVDKYGKKYIDAAMDGKILIGAPFAMVQELFENNLWSEYSDGYKTYRVLTRPAVYVEELNKITAKAESNIIYPFTKLVVSVRNGRVSSINYL